MRLIALCLCLLIPSLANAAPPGLPTDLKIRQPSQSERWEFKHRLKGWSEKDIRRGIEILERLEAEEPVSPLDLWHVLPAPKLPPIPDGLGPHC